MIRISPIILPFHPHTKRACHVFFSLISSASARSGGMDPGALTVFVQALPLISASKRRKSLNIASFACNCSPPKKICIQCSYFYFRPVALITLVGLLLAHLRHYLIFAKRRVEVLRNFLGAACSVENSRRYLLPRIPKPGDGDHTT